MEKRIGRYTVAITHPEKRLFDHITKGQMIEYYEKIADTMLPYLKNRALMMHRFPNGIKEESFYQKDISSYFPSWITTASVPKTGGHNTFVVCQNKATLVYLANQACITPHLWLSRVDKLNVPDRIIFDLDPSGEFRLVQDLALTLRSLLETLGLRSFVMTTGSHGLHVIAPITRSYEFAETREFATLCAQLLVKEYPEKATLEMRKEKRGTKVFVDTLRNQYGATAVAPYALRAYAKAPVATPLHWDEVSETDLSSQKYTLSTIFERISQTDPWADFFTTRQSLTRPFARIKKFKF